MWLITNRTVLFVVGLVLTLGSPKDRMDLRYCGFEQKCDRNRTAIPQKGEPCCLPCECGDICEEKGTCCDDKKGLGDTIVGMKQQCIPALYTPEGFGTGTTTLRSYYARTRCPSAFKDLTIKDRCESDKPETLADITFVSSIDGTIVYKNRFCGLCNNEKNFKTWDMVVPNYTPRECRRLKTMNNVNVESLKEHLLSFCFIAFIKPSNVDIRSVLCFNKAEVVNQCNQTGQWEVYDSHLENLCLNQSHSTYYIHHEDSTEGQVFGNLYCFLCNTNADTDPSKCSDMFKKITFPKSLYKLINQNLWTESDVRNRLNANRCLDNQILDTFFNRCRTLHCPKWSLPHLGRCVPFIDTELTYALVVRLVPQGRVDNSELVRNELKTRYVIIQRNLGFGECKLCYVNIFLEKGMDGTNLREIYVSFKLEPTERCNLVSLWSKLTSMEKSSAHVKFMLNKTEVRFEVFWFNETRWRTDRYEKILATGSKVDCLAFPPEPGLYCPKVKLTMTEYKSVLRRHNNAKELVFAPNKEDMNGSMFVCCDNYITRQHGSRVLISDVLTPIAIIFAICFSGISI